MNQKTKSVIFCILFFVINGCSQSGRHGYTSPGGEFSYEPPEHWLLRDVPGYKYKFAMGQMSEGFTPNIVVVDEHAPVSMDDYVTGSLRALQQMHEKTGSNPPRILSQAEFTTDSNEKGVKIITESDMNGKKLRQIYYFFEGKNGYKFVVTCSAPGAGGESYDKLFDATMKTFKASPA
jgi:hypothetical protein